MSTKELIDSALEHLRTSASVKTVYGEPMVIDGKTVIPVAKVAYAFGSGNGKKEKGERQTAEQGEGAGGGLSAKPIGVVEISGKETKFVPIGTTKKLAIAGLVGSAVGLFVGLILGKRRVKN
jgi:uncharacterized spore protein YtfJ